MLIEWNNHCLDFLATVLFCCASLVDARTCFKGRVSPGCNFLFQTSFFLIVTLMKTGHISETRTHPDETQMHLLPDFARKSQCKQRERIARSCAFAPNLDPHCAHPVLPRTARTTAPSTAGAPSSSLSPVACATPDTTETTASTSSASTTALTRMARATLRRGSARAR